MRTMKIAPAAALLAMLIGAGATLSGCYGHPGYDSDRGHHHHHHHHHDHDGGGGYDHGDHGPG